MSDTTGIKCKSERGRVSDEQRNFIDRVRQAGGIAGVARSVGEARALVERWPAAEDES